MTKNETLGNSEIIKNCPFCGSSASLNYFPADEDFTVSLYGVWCDSCACNYGSSENIKDTLKTWNTRASDAKLDWAVNEVEHHVNNGHKELASNWVLNLLKELGE